VLRVASVNNTRKNCHMLSYTRTAAAAAASPTCKLLAVDGVAASAVATLKVTTLRKCGENNTMIVSQSAYILFLFHTDTADIVFKLVLCV
jgi:hypothetical protein